MRTLQALGRELTRWPLVLPHAFDNGLNMRVNVMTVVGNRPQFVKAAIVHRRLVETPDLRDRVSEYLIHTGQHYDSVMSDVFFEELGLPTPDLNLGVGSGAIVDQIGRMLPLLRAAIADVRPDVLLVYGDTNSTLAGALAAAHAGVQVVHVEAGERIYRRDRVPEEINRVVADQLAHYCLTATPKAARYLYREGFSRQRVVFVGDPMLDLFNWGMARVDDHATLSLEKLGIRRNSYNLATIHRVENTDNIDHLVGLLGVLDQTEHPTILPIHPRVEKLLATAGWQPSGSLQLMPPAGYFDLLLLLKDCRLCVTDSGGVSRESFFAGKPSVVPMPNCWWPEIIEAGWSRTTGSDLTALSAAIASFQAPSERPTDLFGDGDSAGAILNFIVDTFPAAKREGAWHRLGSSDDLPAPRSSAGFSLVNYAEMCRALLDRGYSFARFADAPSLLEQKATFVLMRHDIDFDLGRASRLAEIEADLGVSATYFFMLRTEFYNVFSREGTVAVQAILNRGHRIGLHFDAAAYPRHATTKEISQACALEADLLSRWFGTAVEAVSFHRPGPRVLEGDSALTAPLPHTYMNVYREHIHYLSDSGGEWRQGHPLESPAFAQARPLHLLVHPIWWQASPTSPFETLMSFLDERQFALERSAAQNCKVLRIGYLSGISE